ncbi:MAG: type II toxin-antitoxin system VapC family toxin [Acidimicrobiia bacterium]
MHYLDTSAAVKLVFDEPESEPLRTWFESVPDRVASSDLLTTELLRTTRRIDPGLISVARELLEAMSIVTLTRSLYGKAAELEPIALRSLDAIHITAALSLGPDLESLVTYDARMAEGAESLGIDVIAPI